MLPDAKNLPKPLCRNVLITRDYTVLRITQHALGFRGIPPGSAGASQLRSAVRYSQWSSVPVSTIALPVELSPYRRLCLITRWALLSLTLVLPQIHRGRAAKLLSPTQPLASLAPPGNNSCLRTHPARLWTRGSLRSSSSQDGQANNDKAERDAAESDAYLVIGKSSRIPRPAIRHDRNHLWLHQPLPGIGRGSDNLSQIYPGSLYIRRQQRARERSPEQNNQGALQELAIRWIQPIAALARRPKTCQTVAVGQNPTSGHDCLRQ
jgi:hypothetical protein